MQKLRRKRKNKEETELGKKIRSLRKKARTLLIRIIKNLKKVKMNRYCCLRKEEGLMIIKRRKMNKSLKMYRQIWH